VKNCAPQDLSEFETGKCILIITAGGAVDPQSVCQELPLARKLAVAKTSTEIVGIGAIKRIRIAYAQRVMRKSGFAFDPATPELGYVAIDEKYRGRQLSREIVAALLSCSGPLFATTDSEHMKRTLAVSGFNSKGHEWQGNRSKLSLWIKV
jgi:predicted GNAT family N-acyltransferase